MHETFGTRIKKLRLHKQKYKKPFWSLDSLGSRIGISGQALSLIERDITTNPSLEIIKGLAIQFCVTTDYLIFGEEKIETNIISLELPSVIKKLSVENIKIKVQKK